MKMFLRPSSPGLPQPYSWDGTVKHEPCREYPEDFSKWQRTVTQTRWDLDKHSYRGGGRGEGGRDCAKNSGGLRNWAKTSGVGSIPRPGVTCGLSLLLVLFTALRVLSRFSGFPLSTKINTPNTVARGFWERQRSAFFDVRGCHLNADSYRDLDPHQIFRQECSPLQIIEQLTEKTWGRGCFFFWWAEKQSWITPLRV